MGNAGARRRQPFPVVTGSQSKLIHEGQSLCPVTHFKIAVAPPEIVVEIRTARVGKIHFKDDDSISLFTRPLREHTRRKRQDLGAAYGDKHLRR